MPIFSVPDEETLFKLENTKICSRCNENKSISDFNVYRRRKRIELQAVCKDCSIKYNIKWRAENNESFNFKRRENRKNNPEFFRLQEKKYAQDLKSEFLIVYGGCCNCCGESHRQFLSLDHIDGKGNEHRFELTGNKRGGSTRFMLEKLKKLNWPKDNYQILCYNCNIAKSQNNNICSHEELRRRLLNVA